MLVSPFLKMTKMNILGGLEFFVFSQSYQTKDIRSLMLIGEFFGKFNKSNKKKQINQTKVQ